MSKAFLAAVLQDSFQSTGIAAQKGAEDLVNAIVREIVTTGGFTLPGFGTFTAHDTAARSALNPRTQETVQVEAGSTVRFKASPVLKTTVKAARQKPGRKAKVAPPKAKAAPPAAKETKPAARGRKKT